MEDQRFELIDYLKIIWKRKVLILGISLLGLVLAIGYWLATEPVYEIDAIIQTGRILVQNTSGDFDEVMIEDPRQIANKINHEAFNLQIAALLKINRTEIPRLRAEYIEGTYLTRVWVRSANIKLSQAVLNAVIDLTREDIDKKIDTEIKNIDANIKNQEIERLRREKEREILMKKLKIVSEREKEILADMKGVKERIQRIEQEQLSTLRKESKSEVESLGMLLYSNEIQENYQDYNLLKELLTTKKLEGEDINVLLKENEERVEKIDNLIKYLGESKGRMDYSRAVKVPTASALPVRPGLAVLVFGAACVGFVLSLILALLLEYIQRRMSISD